MRLRRRASAARGRARPARRRRAGRVVGGRRRRGGGGGDAARAVVAGSGRATGGSAGSSSTRRPGATACSSVIEADVVDDLLLVDRPAIHATLSDAARPAADRPQAGRGATWCARNSWTSSAARRDWSGGGCRAGTGWCGGRGCPTARRTRQQVRALRHRQAGRAARRSRQHGRLTAGWLPTGSGVPVDARARSSSRAAWPTPTAGPVSGRVELGLDDAGRGLDGLAAGDPSGDRDDRFRSARGRPWRRARSRSRRR